jgi:ribosomal RNA-processing protein 12
MLQIRRTAQQGVCIVLKGSLFMLQDNIPSHHPAAAMTAKHCIQVIEATGGMCCECFKVHYCLPQSR